MSRPITPRRRYHDEFSELAMAINYMMHELVRRQELLVHSHKLKAIGTLTAGVAHELNNPINNLMLTAAALEEDYAELSEEERLFLLMKEVEGYSIEDLSRLFACNENTVKVKLFRARRKLAHLARKKLLRKT